MGFFEKLEFATRVIKTLSGVEWEKWLVREKKLRRAEASDLRLTPPADSAAQSQGGNKAPAPELTPIPTPSPSPTLTPSLKASTGSRPSGVPDEVLISDARRRLKDEGLKLREHLTQGCTISGYPCDCCEKGMVYVGHALEDILAVTPGDEAALAFHNWVAGHRSEVEANHAIEQKRGLVLASEVRSHLKACGAQEAPTATLESLGLRVQRGELTLEQAQAEARKMGAQAGR